MKFNCKEISISDEDLGCTLTLSENEDDDISEINMTTDEILNSMGQYIMLQRTYPENQYEDDYYYFESNDFDKCGKLYDYKIELSRTMFLLTFENEVFEIQIDVDDNEFKKLKQIIKKITNKKGQVNFLD